MPPVDGGHPVGFWIWAALAVAGLLALLLVDRLLSAAERRGYVHWRKRRPSRVTVSTALLSLQSIYEPQKVHIGEERRRIDVDQPGEDEPLKGR